MYAIKEVVHIIVPRMYSLHNTSFSFGISSLILIVYTQTISRIRRTIVNTSIKANMLFSKFLYFFLLKYIIPTKDKNTSAQIEKPILGNKVYFIPSPSNLIYLLL